MGYNRKQIYKMFSDILGSSSIKHISDMTEAQIDSIIPHIQVLLNENGLYFCAKCTRSFRDNMTGLYYCRDYGMTFFERYENTNQAPVACNIYENIKNKGNKDA